MSKFKLNERVAFYNEGCRTVGVIKYVFFEGNCYNIDYHDGYTKTCHEKQIRRLVKKKKEKLGRELWFCRSSRYGGDGDFYRHQTRPDGWDEVIHVREILE